MNNQIEQLDFQTDLLGNYLPPDLSSWHLTARGSDALNHNYIYTGPDSKLRSFWSSATDNSGELIISRSSSEPILPGSDLYESATDPFGKFVGLNILTERHFHVMIFNRFGLPVNTDTLTYYAPFPKIHCNDMDYIPEVKTGYHAKVRIYKSLFRRQKIKDMLFQASGYLKFINPVAGTLLIPAVNREFTVHIIHSPSGGNITVKTPVWSPGGFETVSASGMFDSDGSIISKYADFIGKAVNMMQNITGIKATITGYADGLIHAVGQKISSPGYRPSK